MSGHRSFLSHPWRLVRWAVLAGAVPAVWACSSRTLEAPVVTPTQTVSNKVVQKVDNNIDILFMVDNSSSMTQMQTKLLAQLPNFMTVLQGLPMGLPSVQIAVVSSDMGANSDSDFGCSQTGGNNGEFQVMPEGSCLATTLNASAEFITDDEQGTTKNFSMPDPMGISKVFQCIGLLGSTGCGFEHQLASIDRALGSDAYPNPPNPPSTNANFLRDDAYLGIVMLTNEDDCSAPANTSIFSLNGQQSISNPDGPIANYRCNGGPRGGHVCLDPNGANPTQYATPPLIPPGDATAGPPPELGPLTCKDNDTGSSALIPVSTFVQHIKALKQDPANQILVAAVAGPATPYKVEWLPGTGPDATELWPQVEHSCTSQNGDGSFADPAVRITQFVNSFEHHALASICDNDYQASMVAIAAAFVTLIKPQCIAGQLQMNAAGNPNCTVTNEVKNNGITTEIPVPSCVDRPGAAPCWNLLAAGATDPVTMAPNNCPSGTHALSVTTDPNNMNPQSLDSLVQCSTCVVGIGAPGCPCLNNGTDVSGCI